MCSKVIKILTKYIPEFNDNNKLIKLEQDHMIKIMKR